MGCVGAGVYLNSPLKSEHFGINRRQKKSVGCAPQAEETPRKFWHSDRAQPTEPKHPTGRPALVGRTVQAKQLLPPPPPPAPGRGCGAAGEGREGVRQGCIWKRGVGTPHPPFKGAQLMPSHCLPDGKCQLQWHL